MPETMGGRSAIRSSPYAIRHTPSQVSISRDAFPVARHFASYVRMNFVTWWECYNVRVYTDGSTARKRESTWHVP